jgi:hypothetical protein
MEEDAELANLDDHALFFGNAQPQPRLGSRASRHRPPPKNLELPPQLSHPNCSAQERTSIASRIFLARSTNHGSRPSVLSQRANQELQKL